MPDLQLLCHQELNLTTKPASVSADVTEALSKDIAVLNSSLIDPGGDKRHVDFSRSENCRIRCVHVMIPYVNYLLARSHCTSTSKQSQNGKAILRKTHLNLRTSAEVFEQRKTIQQNPITDNIVKKWRESLSRKQTALFRRQFHDGRLVRLLA